MMLTMLKNEKEVNRIEHYLHFLLLHSPISNDSHTTGSKQLLRCKLAHECVI